MHVSLQKKKKREARRNRLKASAMASFQLPMRTLHPYNHKSVIVFTLIGGTLLTLILFVGNLYNENPKPMSVIGILVDWVLNALLFYVQFVFVFSVIKNEKWAPGKRWIIGITGAIVMALLYAFLARAMRLWVIDEAVIRLPVNVQMLKGLAAAVMVLLVTWLIYTLVQHQQMQLENQRLSEENIRMRYDALVAQLDPHFLFNSLNTLNGLIGFDNDRAHDYVQQLSRTYRYIMQTSKVVPLADELAFVDAYIYLMQIRYGEGLVIKKDILPEASERQIVPISLQLLIENAVKHNVASMRHPLCITISTPDADTLEVTNNVAPRQEEPKGKKVGLANLVERYRMVTTSRNVTISRTTNTFSVTIPLLTK